MEKIKVILRIILFLVLLSIFSVSCSNKSFPEEYEEICFLQNRDGVVCLTKDTMLGIAIELALVGGIKEIVYPSKLLRIEHQSTSGRYLSFTDTQKPIPSGTTLFFLPNATLERLSVVSVQTVLAQPFSYDTDRFQRNGTPVLLGDFDQDDTVSLVDFVSFTNHYGTSRSAEYGVLYDIAPAEDRYGDGWAGIYDYTNPDGSINLFDFVVFGANYGKQIPAEIHIPYAPENKTPINGSSGVSLTPVFSWNPSQEAATYDIYLGLNIPPVLLASDITGSEYSPSSSLASGRTYYWQVSAKNSAGASPKSDTWSFSTKTPSSSYALIYNGPVAAEECPEAAAAVARTAGLSIRYISDISALPGLLPDAAVFIIGGTEEDLDPLIQAFTPAVDSAFKEWLRNGGRFWGICGGGFLASQGWWERSGFVKMLGIIPAESDDFLTHSRARILPIHWLDTVRAMYFQGGPKFILKSTTEKVKIIARYSDGQIAALLATYGNGKVAVCGPHPEAPRSWSYETPTPEDWVSSMDLAVALVQELLSDNPVQ
jgi:hypothetical protein